MIARHLLPSAVPALLFLVSASFGLAQSSTQLALAQKTTPPATAWQTAAGGHMEFEVASIRQDTSGVFKPPSIALSADDSSQPSDGLFRADFSLPVYIEFAYKIWLSPDQRKAIYANLPKWVSADSYLIEARSPGKPTKDQVRLMMQSLLTQRFGLRLHFETQPTAVFVMTLAKPGVLGPHLHRHADGPPCPQPGQPMDTSVFPPFCEGYLMHSLPNHDFELGSRDTTMQLLANSLTSLGGGLDRPIIDRTGLTGRYDFTLEFSPAANRTSASTTPDSGEPQGPSTLEAVHEQLGFKFGRAVEPIEVPVIDHIDRPTEN